MNARPAKPWWDYPRFKGKKVRVLLVALRHLLVHELVAGFRRSGHTCEVLFIPGETVDLSQVTSLFEQALRAIKPDFLVTVNHRGFDQEGHVTRMLEGYRIPFASWYVDSPQLILGHYKENTSPFLTLFFWDRDYLGMFRDLGFERVEYLPLGVDERLFRPASDIRDGTAAAPVPVAFVGNSMFHKAGLRLAKSGVRGPLRDRFPELSLGFIHAREQVVRDFLRNRHPELFRTFQGLDETQALAYETGITWQATGLYRLERVKRLSGLAAVIAGDPGWDALLGGNGFRLRRELNYYEDLPSFYKATTLCFNATSRQMKQGVNQRVFDVPACRRPLLTDWTEQLVDLMEPGKEVLAYRSLEEIPQMAEKTLHDPVYRDGIAHAGYRRVLADHTYSMRLAKLVHVMRVAASSGP